MIAQLNLFTFGFLFVNIQYTSTKDIAGQSARGDEDGLDEGDHLGEDEPVLNPLDVRGWGQLFQHADQQISHRQHHRQVHRYGCIEEFGKFEEDSHVAQEDQDY